MSNEWPPTELTTAAVLACKTLDELKRLMPPRPNQKIETLTAISFTVRNNELADYTVDVKQPSDLIAEEWSQAKCDELQRQLESVTYERMNVAALDENLIDESYLNSVVDAWIAEHPPSPTLQKQWDSLSTLPKSD